MIIRELVTQSEHWNDLIESHGGHPLQLWGWGALKSAYGWRAERYAFYSAERKLIGLAQILYRRLPRPLRALAYVPRGPVVVEAADSDQVYRAVQEAAGASKFRPVAITIEPHAEIAADLDAEAFAALDPSDVGLPAGWRRAPEEILIPQTMLLDLTRSEDELMAGFRKKTRYSVRKSLRAEVEMGVCEDGSILDEVLPVYHETAQRAGFALHSDDYYRDLASAMGENAPIIYAHHDGKLIAFSWLAVSRGVAFELYGGSDDVARRLDTNYALKWHAIKYVKERGVAQYDVNGLLNDAISTFKRGFSRHENLLIGTWDYPLSRLYPIWARALPAARELRRKMARRRK